MDSRQNLPYEHSFKIEQSSTCPDVPRFSRRQRGIHSRPNSEEPEAISGVLSEQSTVLPDVHALRAKNCASHLGQDNALPDVLSTSKVHKRLTLFGRHIDVGELAHRIDDKCQSRHRFVQQTGYHNKYEKINSVPNSVHRISGHSMEWTKRSLGHNRGQTTPHYEVGARAACETLCISKGVGGFHGPSQFCHISPQEACHTLSSCGKAKYDCTSQCSRCQGHSAHHQASSPESMDGCTHMVDPSSLYSSNATAQIMDGCLSQRVRCVRRGCQNGAGRMEPRRNQAAHKCSRAKNSGNSDQGAKPHELDDTARNRQHSCYGSDQQMAIKLSTHSSGATQLTTDLYQKQLGDTSHQDTYTPQHNSRRVEQGSEDSRVGIEKRNIPQASDLGGSPGGGSHGISSEQETGKVCRTLRTSRLSSIKCPDMRLEQVECSISLPTSSNDTVTATQHQNIQGTSPHDYPMEPSGNVVPIHSQQVLRSPSPQRSPALPGKHRLCVRRLQQLREMDRSSFIKECLIGQVGDVVIAERVLRGYRTSTRRQAQSIWKSFKAWLPATVDVLQDKHLFQFFVYLRDKKNLLPATILNYKTSLEWPLHLGFGIQLKDRLYKQLINGMFNDAPPVKKRIPDWSLNHALETIISKFSRPNDPFHLLAKTLFLTALASGNRVSELAAVTREGVQFRNNYVTLPTKSNFLYKNQTATRTPPEIVFEGLPGSPVQCPVRALKTYLEATKDSTETSVFLHPTTKKGLKGGRLSYWLRKSIELFVNDGRAHDMRKVAFSAAFQHGTSLTDIIQHGFWSTPNPFLSKYCTVLPKCDIPCVAGRQIIS